MLFDFRLQVFQAVATRLNFTKAASELFISQPAVTKHIHELEGQLKIKLFERNGSKINLTEAGKLLLSHTDQIFEAYWNLEFDINALAGRHSGVLRLGASTTLAQYVLPPVLAAFHKKFPDVQVTLTVNNTEQIEQLLQQKAIDLGVIEGFSKNIAIKYTQYLKDEIVLVCSMKNTVAKSGSIAASQLKEISLLLREPGSGTLEVIGHVLKEAGMSLSDLKSEMQLGGSESIKLYMLHSDCMAFLSIHAVLKELQNKECFIVDVDGLSIERYFYFAQLHGQPEALAELFTKFAFRNAGALK